MQHFAQGYEVIPKLQLELNDAWGGVGVARERQGRMGTWNGSLFLPG